VGCGGHAATTARTPSPSPSSSAPACSGLVLLGLRGQGQSTRGHDGMGREAGQVATALVDRLSGTPVRVVRVRFPARSGDATYDADVRAGVRAAGRVIGSTCGRVVLVGYSQGAEVVHRLVVAHPR